MDDIKIIKWGNTPKLKNEEQEQKEKKEEKDMISFGSLFFNDNKKIIDIPDFLEVNIYNCDISEIDIIIKNKIELDKNKKINKNKELINQEKEKLKTKMNMVKIKKSLEIIKTCEEKLLDLDKEYNDYIKCTYDLLLIYKNFVRDRNKKFGEKIDESISQEKLDIIFNYLDVAKRFIPISIKTEDKITCHNCGMNEEKDDSGYCKNCGVEKILISRDVVLIQHNIKIDSRDRDNFHQTILRFQGKQEDKIPGELYKKLDEFFATMRIPSSDIVKEKKQKNEKLNFTISRQLILDALKELKYSEYYKDLNLISYKYWNIQLPDITDLEKRLMDDFDLTQAEFEKIRKTKQSTLNSQYRLFKHLQLLNYKCDMDEFKMIKTRETLEKCEVLWEEMCKGCGLKFISMI